MTVFGTVFEVWTDCGYSVRVVSNSLEIQAPFGRNNGNICITVGTNGITNGTIGRTLDDIGIPLVEPRTHAQCVNYLDLVWLLIRRGVIKT